MQSLHDVPIASACPDQNTRLFFVLVGGFNFNFFVEEKRIKYEDFGGKKGKEEDRGGERGKQRGACPELMASHRFSLGDQPLPFEAGHASTKVP